MAFRGTLAVGTGGVTAATNTGVWSSSNGVTTAVAQAGMQAPGCVTGVTFKTFDAIALPDAGGVVMLATLNTNPAADITAANRKGIWAVDATGTLRLIVKEGGTVNGKLITGLSFLPIINEVAGQTRNFNQTTGDIAYLATFGDHSTAIVEVVFP